MGQLQYRNDDMGGKGRQDKEAPIEKDRATASFERRIENNPAMKWKDSKPAPVSRPT
jgi:hypothetical protein